MSRPLLDASTRVAIAAYLHDLGKLAQRADIDHQGKLSGHITTHCPTRDGRPTHLHAAYTGIAWAALERVRGHFPDLHTGDTSPFEALPQEADGVLPDSIANAAGMHHRPETAMQWILATADRVASGFERSEFDRDYNSRSERADFRRARLLAPFESIGQDTCTEDQARWRQPLAPLGPETIMPVPAAEAVPGDEATATAQYRALWNTLIEGIALIPPGHVSQLPLWLDHFDSLWMSVAHAIPSATATGSRPDVSLYDHSRTTAALAVALWRELEATQLNEEQIAALLRDREDGWQRPSFRLILGDLAGIQDFVFANGASVTRQAAKLLRGRSLGVALLTEAAALSTLEAFDLPPTSVVLAAAGKFLIVAPNLPDADVRLDSLRTRFDDWFIRELQGRTGIAIASVQASCADLARGRFNQCLGQLYGELEVRKLQRFDLCKPQAPGVLGNTLHAFERGACELDERLPADSAVAHRSRLSETMVKLGESLVRGGRLAITRAPLPDALPLDFLGWSLAFTDSHGGSKALTEASRSGNLVRLLDFSAAEIGGEIWHGCARRFFSGYIPVTDDAEGRRPVTFDELGEAALAADTSGAVTGLRALGVIKGDVDDLGQIFSRGLQSASFARWASLSRSMNAWFALRLPWLLASDPQLRQIYTVFAGGDDFFLVAPWNTAAVAAGRLRADFSRYVANPAVHFSLGIAVVRPKVPVRALADHAEAALALAKSHRDAQGKTRKNACALFDQAVAWEDWDALLGDRDSVLAAIREAEAALTALADEAGPLSTQYLYAMIGLAQARQSLDDYAAGSGAFDARDALWSSQLAYRTRRMVEERLRAANGGRREDLRRQLQAQLGKTFGTSIERWGTRFHLPLFLSLYARRQRKAARHEP